jgi:hypothetical protein
MSDSKEFLAVKADTPIEKKSHFTAEVVGAAGAYEVSPTLRFHPGPWFVSPKWQRLIPGVQAV